MMEILMVDREALIQKLLNSGTWHHKYGDDTCWIETNPDLIDFVNSKKEKAKGSQLEYVIPPLTYEEAKELGLIPPNQRLDLMTYLAEERAKAEEKRNKNK